MLIISYVIILSVQRLVYMGMDFNYKSKRVLVQITVSRLLNPLHKNQLLGIPRASGEGRRADG